MFPDHFYIRIRDQIPNSSLHSSNSMLLLFDQPFNLVLSSVENIVIKFTKEEKGISAFDLAVLEKSVTANDNACGDKIAELVNCDCNANVPGFEHLYKQILGEP